METEPADGQDGRQERCFPSCQGQDPVSLPKEKRPGQAPCDASQPPPSVLITGGRWSSLLVDLSPLCRPCLPRSLPIPPHPLLPWGQRCPGARRPGASLLRTAAGCLPGPGGRHGLAGEMRKGRWGQQGPVGCRTSGRKKGSCAQSAACPTSLRFQMPPRAHSGPSMQKTADLGLDLQWGELPGRQSWALRAHCCREGAPGEHARLTL